MRIYLYKGPPCQRPALGQDSTGVPLEPPPPSAHHGEAVTYPTLALTEATTAATLGPTRACPASSQP